VIGQRRVRTRSRFTLHVSRFTFHVSRFTFHASPVVIVIIIIVIALFQLVEQVVDFFLVIGIEQRFVGVVIMKWDEVKEIRHGRPPCGMAAVHGAAAHSGRLLE
jgi:hypothetical protein